MARSFIAGRHPGELRDQAALMFRSASQISCVAGSSLGKCPRVMMIFRTRVPSQHAEREIDAEGLPIS